MNRIKDRTIILEYLQKTHLSELISSNTIDLLTLWHFDHNEFLCREGAEFHDLLFLVDGKCKIYKTLANGKSSLIRCCSKFEILGECEFFENTVCRTTIQAIGDVYCFSLPTISNRQKLLEDNKLLILFGHQLSKKLGNVNQNNAINLFYPLEQRLASYILFSEIDGVFMENHVHLAEFLGCSHRHLLRILRTFRENGLLTKDVKGFRVSGRTALMELAGDSYCF